MKPLNSKSGYSIQRKSRRSRQGSYHADYQSNIWSTLARRGLQLHKKTSPFDTSDEYVESSDDQRSQNAATQRSDRKYRINAIAIKNMTRKEITTLRYYIHWTMPIWKFWTRIPTLFLKVSNLWWTNGKACFKAGELITSTNEVTAARCYWFCIGHLVYIRTQNWMLKHRRSRKSRHVGCVTPHGTYIGTNTNTKANFEWICQKEDHRRSIKDVQSGFESSAADTRHQPCDCWNRYQHTTFYEYDKVDASELADTLYLKTFRVLRGNDENVIKGLFIYGLPL